jgi:hypothetical protein
LVVIPSAARNLGVVVGNERCLGKLGMTGNRAGNGNVRAK